MENKRKRITGSDTNKVIAKVGSSNLRKLKNEESLPSKRQENAMIKDPTEQKSIYVNKPHMLFR